MDGEAQIGILIWEQCDTQRVWRSLDVMVAKTIADQVTLAVNNAKLRSLMKSLAVTEEQSGLIKRSSYLDVLQSEVRRAMTQNSTSTIMLVSLDASLRIKELGEAGVDAAMDKVAKSILPLLRQNDIAVRYNLSTIALLLPDTNGKNAFFVHEKVRKAVGDLRIPGCPADLQMNVGIAEALVDREFEPVDIVTELINRAESALLMARSDGGNKAHAIAPAYTAVA
jgi:diguanylate cyclase (GGDEF)-like protein